MLHASRIEPWPGDERYTQDVCPAVALCNEVPPRHPALCHAQVVQASQLEFGDVCWEQHEHQPLRLRKCHWVKPWSLTTSRRPRAQAVQAAQITFEDFFLSSMDISPLKIVGFEGLWGSAAMVLLLLPLVQFLPGKEGAGIHEDTLESLHVRGLRS